ncbi:protein translocase subunit secG [Methyloglobulus morosus KoM1]|uniref:Protein-export membrane protein SecG n=1 Tax=Methyloglobulus morosus KoM1 TaxID=1116472 RepID=V5BVC3_9GAMM|nr:protein translocase subunit secG [Methyloglobulus morosus KoM1]
MYQVIIVIHILLGLSIIGLILMQQGKGADAGATFGGGASGSVFGAQGAASFLSRTTAILAALFFSTSLGLAWINGNKTGAAVDFIGTPAVEKEVPDSGLPNVDGANIKESLPAAPVPQSNEGGTIPPPPVAVPPVSAKQPVPVVVPSPAMEQKTAAKAEDTKVVEEQESELKTEEPPKKAAKKK